MCEGFGIIVDRELNLWFSEPDYGGDCSHSITIERLGWQENGDVHLRHFVRAQFGDWTPASFEFEEYKTLPGWCENAKEEICEKCEALLARCAPAQAEYVKVRDMARAVRDKVCNAAWAEYAKVCNAAWAEYEKVRNAALAELIAVWTFIPGYMSEKDNAMTLKNAYTISPDEIEAGDEFCYAVKLMVVRKTKTGQPIYRVYRCLFEGDNVPQGERIDQDREVAVMQALFPVVAWARGKADPA